MTPTQTRRSTTVVGATVAVLMVLGGLSAVERHTAFSAVQAQTTWRCLVIAPERRCAPYEAADCRYSQSLEDRIVDELRGVYGPYTSLWFAAKSETDIEQMVGRSEVHVSGLSAADSTTRHRFATDLLNLTLAGPNVNLYQKVDKDAVAWLPDQNRCWFSASVIAIRQKYDLTIDQRGADALDHVPAACSSTVLITVPHGSVSTAAAPARSTNESITEWDDDRNGRVSRAAAGAHGTAPVGRDHPAYPFMRDGDGDGMVSESGWAFPPPAKPEGPPSAPHARGPYRNCTELSRDHPNGVPETTPCTSRA